MLFDTSKDDRIDIKEFSEAMRSIGLETSDDEIREMIREVDKDGVDSIDFSEFLILMAKCSNDAETEQQLRDCFDAFDVDHKGFLTRECLQAAVLKFAGESLTEDEIDAILIEAGLFTEDDPDPRISFHEFLDLLCAASGGAAEWNRRSSVYTARGPRPSAR